MGLGKLKLTGGPSTRIGEGRMRATREVREGPPTEFLLLIFLGKHLVLHGAFGPFHVGAAPLHK